MPNEILPQAIAAIQAGDKERGRQLLIELVRSDVDNESAWLWLVRCVDKVEHKRECFERVLEINPSNNYAQQGLHLLGLLDKLELPVDTFQNTTYTQVQPNDTGAATKHQLLQVRLERVSSELQRIFSEKIFDFPIGCWSLIPCPCPFHIYIHGQLRRAWIVLENVGKYNWGLLLCRSIGVGDFSVGLQ